MKPYRIRVKVSTTYTVEVHADDKMAAWERATELDPDEVEAQGLVDSTYVLILDAPDDIEEIQREGGEE